ncbi:NADH:flavin oxidoreductase/NADH oxidase (plasmid) [Thalassobaculum sp. OXR-137]|uniref:NADH:flavin oxidoreductase/NADH oxidase n=1 Tax=Thalassobaculum sp. OXR-137 TaxID=3100173 RepID=UPI002AC8B0F6|nr:NADH:flavin oxidoreductase/NADH oxidase [Thalassobaculum sp. OXR-137]WPZ37188.1 NADH:flavin oxidoreductase/NADH oxidase [Thalassobaculum sp. OXR-137]
MTTAEKPALLTPLTLRGVELPNRMVLSPMQTYMAGTDGQATDWHFQHLARFATGGFGAVMTEALMVTPEGRNTYGDLGLWEDAQIAPLARIARFMKSAGAVPAAQLHHAGPKASRQRPWDGRGPLVEADAAARGETAWRPVAAWNDSTVEGWHIPRTLEIDEIREIVKAFGAAAARAVEAGFEFIDIHSAHGYLLHSFLSPVSNYRQDAYGGDLHGRMRFSLEVAEAVRANLPDEVPLVFRLSCVDWRPDLDDRTDGWTIEDTLTLSAALRERGVDMIDCSSGGIRAASSGTDFLLKRQKLQRGHQVPYAARIRQDLEMPTMAVGVIIDGPQAEEILQQGSADLIAIGREALVDPHWALNAAGAVLGAQDWDRWPSSYGWWLRMREDIGIAG